MKKKYMVLLMVCALLFSGCAGLQQVQDDVTKPAADYVCNAPAEVVSVADMVINLLKPIMGSLVPGTGPYLALVTAEGIKTIGCATITELNQMITFIEGVNTERALAYKGAMKAAPLGINVGALKKWRDTRK